MRNSSQLEVRWFSLAARRRPVTMVPPMDHEGFPLIPWFALPSTASIPPLQDSNDAFALKHALDSSIGHAPRLGGAGFPGQSALFSTDGRKDKRS